MTAATADRVLVFAPNWLGDAVMALPCLGTIRRRFPSAAVAVAARPHLAPLFEMVEGVDEVICLERAGRLGGVAAGRRDGRRLRGRFDVAILLPNSFRTAWIARRAGIAERWGYASDRRSHLLTRTVPRVVGVHQSEYYRRLIEALDIAFDPAELTPPAEITPGDISRKELHRERFFVLHVPADAGDWARRTLTSRGWKPGDTLIGMAPGAAYGTAKQWPPERFAQLAVELAENAFPADAMSAANEIAPGDILREELQPERFLVLVGSGGDRAACDEIEQLVAASGTGPRASRAVINLAGATDLRQLAAVTAECRAFVSNDSGAMHLAAALGVPVVAIFGSTNERETAPLPWGAGFRAAHAIIKTDVWCRPCMLRECPLDHACMTGIAPAQVKAEVLRVMAQKNTESRIEN